MKPLTILLFSMLMLTVFLGMNGCKAPIEAPMVSLETPIGLEKPIIPEKPTEDDGPVEPGDNDDDNNDNNNDIIIEPPRCPQAVIDEYQSRKQRITNLRQELVTLPAGSQDRAGILSNIKADTDDLDAFVRSQISRFPGCNILRTL